MEQVTIEVKVSCDHIAIDGETIEFLTDEIKDIIESIDLNCDLITTTQRG